MKTVQLFTAAALGVALVAPAGAWAGQSQPAMPSASGPMTSPAPAASDAATPASAVASDPNAPLGSTANPIPLNSPTPASSSAALMAGDPNVVSNGPVPDTRANRARYGKPLSASGRATQPSGN